MSTAEPTWRRFAYVAIEDAACRTPVVRVLVEAGWKVEEGSTGVHVLQDLCDLIAGTKARTGPGLIVVEHRLRGCTGLTIACGLRELGVAIPIVVIASPQDQPNVHDESIRIVEPECATTVVSEIAAPRSPTLP